MRILALLMLASLALAGETVSVPGVGLVLDMPDGFSRETNREQGSMCFAALYSHRKGQQIRFQVETSAGDDYDADAWLQVQKQSKAHFVKEATESFTPVQGVTVGGRAATVYTFGGKAVQSGNEYDLHFRVAAVVFHGVFFEITQLSYNKAHEENEVAAKLSALWGGIRFQQAKEPEADTTPPAGEPIKHEDQAGNFTLTLPPGWAIEFVQPAVENDGGLGQRVVMSRRDKSGNALVVAEVMRIEMLNSARIFASGTAGEGLDLLEKQEKMFEKYYGEGSAGHIHPRIDESVTLADADKSGAFEFRSTTVEEQQEIKDAEDKQRRGEKGVVIPEYPELVVRGRIALLSPHLYLVRGSFVRRSASEDPTLIAEFNKLLDSFAFLVSAARPPAFRLGDLDFPDTTADPANAEDRKVKAVAQHAGRKIYQMGLEFVAPKGFQLLDRTEIQKFFKDPQQVSIVMIAQDANNNWVHVLMHHSSAKALGDKKLKHGDKREVFDSWRSNWQSKSPSTDIPAKTRKFTLGKIRGEGYEALEGKVDKFRGTFTCMVDDKSGWRTYLEVETRGQGDRVFKDGLDTFYKSLKVKKMKDLK